MDEEDQDDHVARTKIPLFKMEQSVKGWVDFAIMPLFGLANAGVELTTIGPFSAIIFLSATVGKTIGVGMVGWAMGLVGYPPPKGMTPATMFMVGYIASIGLTVALFVSDVAYNGECTFVDPFGFCLFVFVGEGGLLGTIAAPGHLMFCRVLAFCI